MAEEQVVGDLFASQNQKKKNLPREFQIRKAVLKGDLGLLKKEMEKGGVFLDWQDQNKATYAHHAALRGHLEILKYLAEEGASMHLVDADGCPPLHNAAYQGKLECVKFLLKEGTDPNIVDADMASAIHKAAFSGHHTCVKELIDAGGDATSLDFENVSALQKAVYKNHSKCVTLLLEVEGGTEMVNAPDIGGSTGLHKAASQGNEKMLELLLGGGADVKGADNEGITALHQAAANGSEECLKLLLERGADPDAVSQFGMRPIHFASALGSVGCLQLLIENGASIDARDKKGMTPLHYAAKKQNQATVSELLALGADKTLTDKKGRLPIHHVRKHRPVWQLLCDDEGEMSSMSPLVSGDERGVRKRERRKTESRKKKDFRRSSSIRTKKEIQHNNRSIPRTGSLIGTALSMKGAEGTKGGMAASSGDVARRTPGEGGSGGGRKPRSMTVADGLAGKGERKKREKGHHQKGKREKKERKKGEEGEGKKDGEEKKEEKEEDMSQDKKEDENEDKIEEQELKNDEKKEGEKGGEEAKKEDGKTAVGSGGGGGGVLGGGKSLPKGTKKDVAITDAVSAWSGGGEETAKDRRKSRRFWGGRGGERLSMFAIRDKGEQGGGSNGLNLEELAKIGKEGGEKEGELEKEDSEVFKSGDDSSSGVESYVDRWGFMHVSSRQLMTAKPEPRTMEMEMKWLKMMKKFKNKEQYHPKTLKKVGKMCQAGVPLSVRGAVWRVLLNVDEYKKTFPKLYEQLLEQDGDHEIVTQIDLDLNRTLPTHELFREENGTGQTSMRRVLRAYSLYNPNVGYCQGMNFIVALFLMMMEEEEDVFWCLVKLCKPGNGTYVDTADLEKGYGMQGLWEKRLTMVSECVYVFERLLKQHCPRLNAHMEEEGIEAGMFVTKHFITVFLITMPFSTCVRMWDLMLSHGYNVVFTIFISLLKIYEEELLEKKFEAFMTWVSLQHFNDTDCILDADLLVAHSLQLLTKPPAIKPKVLESLRKEHWEIKKIEDKQKEEARKKRQLANQASSSAPSSSSTPPPPSTTSQGHPSSSVPTLSSPPTFETEEKQ